MKILRFAKFVDRLCLNILLVYALITPSNQHEQEPLKLNVTHTDHQRSRASSVENPNVMTTPSALSVPYFRASLPMRIYDCLRDFSTLRCTKLFVLHKMEVSKKWPNSGNITKDFLNQFFGDGDEQMESLISDRYRKMADKDINKRLVLYFQRFFKNRQIKLQFLPGLTVKIVPSPENKLKFSLKKKTKHHQRNARSQNIGLKALLKASGLGDSSLEDPDTVPSSDEFNLEAVKKNKGSKGKKKKHKKIKPSYKTAILQMAVPVMIMPAILMGTFLPFILPVLKMATLTTMIMNNTAFMAALIYAARTHVNAQEEQPINYSYGGGHTDLH